MSQYLILCSSEKRKRKGLKRHACEFMADIIVLFTHYYIYTFSFYFNWNHFVIIIGIK